MRRISYILSVFFVGGILCMGSCAGAQDTDILAIDEMLTDNFFIQTEFSMPCGEAGIYAASMKTFLAEEICSIFWPDIRPVETDSETYEDGVRTLTRQDAILSYYDGSLLYQKEESVNNVRGLLYFGMEENLLEFHELASVAAQEAQEEAEQVLSSLNIGCEYVLTDIKAADIADFEKLQHDLEDADYQYRYDTERLRQISLDSGTEVYCLRYGFELDGISVFNANEPVLEQMGGIDAPALADGMQAEFIISRDGICYVNIDGVLEKEAFVSSDAILDYDGLKEALYDIYGDVIFQEPVTVTEIWLEYIPGKDIVDQNEVELIPVWCCKYIQNHDDPRLDELFAHAIRIHAVTGEVVA